MIENKSLGSKFFDILNVVILIAITLICIVPVWYVLCVSLSSREAVNAGQVALWPVGFNLLSYKKIMGETAFFGSFLVSIKRVLLGTGISMVCILNEKAVPEERYLYVDLRILYVIQRRYGSVVYHHEKL